MFDHSRGRGTAGHSPKGGDLTLLRCVVLLAAMACCLVLLTACVTVQSDGSWSLSLLPRSVPPTQTANTAAGTVQSKGAMPAVGQPGKPAYPGKTQDNKPWNVLVQTEDSPTSLADGAKPAAGKTFMVLDVSIRNSGAGNALVVEPRMFALRDASDRPVAPYPTKLEAYNAISVKPINVAMGGSTAFVYEVPSDSVARYVFTVSPTQPPVKPMSWYVP